METDWLVSIIIPVYNVEFYVDEALESVLNQSYENLEIIIIDDGSTDGSGERCDKCAKNDKRVRIVHQDNKGLSAARNVGLDMMTGDVVAFLDSDDAYHPDFFSELLYAMIKYDTEIAMCKYSIQRAPYRFRKIRKKTCLPQAKQGVFERKEALNVLAGKK